MPPNRSRTQRWREQLDLILARRGGLELNLDQGMDMNQTPDLVWRVRLLEVGDDAIVVEAPGAAGASVEIPIGADIVVAMSVGQNRWMFSTTVRSVVPAPGAPQRSALVLAPPERVERCRRRSFYRVTNARVKLPMVECWGVGSPSSVIAPEIANRSEIESIGRGEPARDSIEPLVLPDGGPMFRAQLSNISGGGVGLIVDPDEVSSFERSRILWLRIDLRPRIAAPLGVTARVAHTHRDSEQNLIAGLAFEFQFNPPHRGFVVDQICRYVEAHRISHPDATAA